MLVYNLTLEIWTGNSKEEKFIEKLNWYEIEATIRELDGKSKNLLVLGCDDEETYMMIGGGNCGKYIVVATLDNFTFYSLVDLSKYDTVEKLIVGGQGVNYPAKVCVDLQLCLKAVKTFTELGKLDSSLTWENGDSLATA